VQSDSHQGVVARVTPRAFVSLEDLVEKAQSVEQMRLLALDGVIDPHNLGAVLRAAECFGVDAVVWSKNRAAPLGPVVSKVSVGASELVPLCPVGNLHTALEKLKAVGVWTVGAVVSADATRLESFDPPNKWALIMGSEGEGIQRLIEENLDFRVYISMLGELSSLNVSQATAVMLHSLVRPSLACS
jgi:23S rRNA (guanosine2251-2'-O)-methyltransferase